MLPQPASSFRGKQTVEPTAYETVISQDGSTTPEHAHSINGLATAQGLTNHGPEPNIEVTPTKSFPISHIGTPTVRAPALERDPLVPMGPTRHKSCQNPSSSPTRGHSATPPPVPRPLLPPPSLSTPPEAGHNSLFPASSSGGRLASGAPTPAYYPHSTSIRLRRQQPRRPIPTSPSITGSGRGSTKTPGNPDALYSGVGARTPPGLVLYNTRGGAPRSSRNKIQDATLTDTALIEPRT